MPSVKGLGFRVLPKGPHDSILTYLGIGFRVLLVICSCLGCFPKGSSRKRDLFSAASRSAPALAPASSYRTKEAIM